MINKTYYNLFLLVILTLFIIFATDNLYANVLTDKMGREVIDIKQPTASREVDPNQISDALRSDSYSSGTFKDPQKNIYSSDAISNAEGLSYHEYIKSLYDNKMYDNLNAYGECTDIRYTVSITNVDDGKYTLIYDPNSDRLKMKVIIDNIYEYDAKNGFYKVNGKTYYFDETGHMVLGPCRDERGNYYFFSYETGELVK